MFLTYHIINLNLNNTDENKLQHFHSHRNIKFQIVQEMPEYIENGSTFFGVNINIQRKC